MSRVQPPAARLSARPRARGFSLIEMMIGLALGLTLVAGVSVVFLTSAGGQRSAETNTVMQTSGQYAIEALRFELLHSGFDSFNGSDASQVIGAVNVANDCLVGFSTNLGQRLWAANDQNPFAGSCVPSSAYLKGDVVAFRRASLARPAALDANRLHARIAFEGASLFQGAAAPANGFIPFEDRRMEASVYFISPYTASPSENPRVPALYRVRLVPGPAISAPELVASGIEDLQIEIGVRDATGSIIFVDPNEVAPAAVTAATTGITEWNSVLAARVHVLVRSERTETGYKPGPRTYQLGSRSVTVSDSFRREVQTSVVQLRNS